jgi:hypothetical protein
MPWGSAVHCSIDPFHRQSPTRGLFAVSRRILPYPRNRLETRLTDSESDCGSCTYRRVHPSIDRFSDKVHSREVDIERFPIGDYPSGIEHVVLPTRVPRHEIS